MRKKEVFATGIIYFLCFIAALSCIIPMLLALSVSLSDADSVTMYGYSFIPRNLNFDAYTYLFKSNKQILNSYGVSAVVTVVGTVLGLLLTAQIAYAISRKAYRYRNAISMILYFTMLFSGGMIPTYIVMTQYLHLKNTLSALIFPSLLSPWNVMLMRTFFEDIPSGLTEAAYIDGANEHTIFYQIVLPISKPALATIGCFLALGYWNDWYNALLYITDTGLEPLQYVLYKISNNIEELQKQLSYFNSANNYFPQEPMRMAMAVVATGPMFLIFAFAQKYFVQGLTIGSVKG